MSDALGREVNVPPFPPLHWEDISWVAETILPSWAGFQSCFGSYGARSSPKASDGRVHLRVGGEGAEESDLPTPEMCAAFAYLKKHEAQVAQAILQAIFKAYPEEKRKYGYGEKEAHTIMPDLLKPDDLKPLIGLHEVHILKTSKNGSSCIGFEFGCTWDLEHGLGVMTHLNRVTKIGGADGAFLEWVAREGLGNT